MFTARTAAPQVRARREQPARESTVCTSPLRLERCPTALFLQAPGSPVPHFARRTQRAARNDVLRDRRPRGHPGPEPAPRAQLRERAMGARPQHARRRPGGQRAASASSSCAAPAARSAAASTLPRCPRARPGWASSETGKRALRKLEAMDPIVVAADPVALHRRRPPDGAGLRPARGPRRRAIRDHGGEGRDHPRHRHVARRPIRGPGPGQAAGARRRQSSTPPRRSSGGSWTGWSARTPSRRRSRKLTDRVLDHGLDVDAADQEADQHGVRHVVRRNSSRPTSSTSAQSTGSPEHHQAMAEHRAHRAERTPR